MDLASIVYLRKRGSFLKNYISNLFADGATVSESLLNDEFAAQHSIIQNESTFNILPGAHKTGTIYAMGSGGAVIPTTFTRNGIGTRFNENGVLETVYNNYPRLDFDPNVIVPTYTCPKLGSNLATDSNTPIFAAGTRNLGIYTGPFGVANAAAEYIKTSASDQFAVIPLPNLPNPSKVHENSVYVRHIGNDMTIRMEHNNSSNWDKAWWASFSITSGNTTVTGTNTNCTSRVENLNNGWYRCIVTLTTGANISGASGNILLRLTGASGDKISLFGGQVNENELTSYIPTTTTPLTAQVGLTTGNRAVRGYHQERASTNLYLNSAILVTQNVTTTATTYTVSFWGTGTITFSGTFSGSLVGTGANNRVSLTFTATAGTLTSTVSGSVLQGQCETSTLTTYIPTTTAAVTRVQEICNSANVSWYNPNEGTLFIDYIQPPTAGVAHMAIALIQDASNMVRFRSGNGAYGMNSIVAGAATNIYVASAPIAKLRYKMAGAMKLGDWAISRNGSIDTSSSSNAPTNPINLITIGTSNGSNTFDEPIKQVAYIPRRLSNAELQALTL